MRRTLRIALCLVAVSTCVAHGQDGPAELPFSPARWADDLLFVSGQVGNVPGTLALVEGGIRAEARQALENVQAVLADHGASMDDVVKCTVMLDDISEWGAFNEVYVGFFAPPRPARSALGADGLALGARVEVECIAFLPEVLAPALEPAGLEYGSFVEEVGGRRIHYEVHGPDGGQAPPLMVVPNSWGLSLEGLRGVLGDLEDHLTVIYFDPRGMGSSGPATVDEDLSTTAVREDFDRLREHLGLDRVHALGWSNGATNLVWLAHEKPETLASAIFVHGTPRFAPSDMAVLAEESPEVFRQFTAAQETLTGGGLSADEQDRVLERLYREVWFPEMLAHPEETVDAVRAAFADAELSWRHSRYAQQEVAVLDQRPLLGDIPVPALVIAGAHDMLPPERVEELATGLPRARFVVFDDSGHFAPLEEPHRFVDLVTTFLQAGD
jgi:reactive intermediate/imine deaminase